MRGAPPKPASMRQRGKRHVTRSTLPSAAESVANDVPELPAIEAGWHPMVVAWWADVWQSPMASEYLQADIRGLYRLAVLENDFWTATSQSSRIAVSTEIRHVGLAFGLSPIDRRRLQWEVEKGETAAQKTASRRGSEKKAPPKDDPRDVLKIA